MVVSKKLKVRNTLITMNDDNLSCGVVLRQKIYCIK